MSQLSSFSSRVRIREFEIDLDSGEFVGNGTGVRLQVQSLALLNALLERPGSIVGREELRQRLWPSDTFVDFDHGLNAAVRRLREAFGDSADTPRFVETIPRKGYRLVAPDPSPFPSRSHHRHRLRPNGSNRHHRPRLDARRIAGPRDGPRSPLRCWYSRSPLGAHGSPAGQLLCLAVQQP